MSFTMDTGVSANVMGKDLRSGPMANDIRATGKTIFRMAGVHGSGAAAGSFSRGNQVTLSWSGCIVLVLVVKAPTAIMQKSSASVK